MKKSKYQEVEECLEPYWKSVPDNFHHYSIEHIP